MKCAFCGCEFDETQAVRACRGCALFGGCEKVKCPRCGYEAPKEPRLVKMVRRWRNKKRGPEAS